MCFQGLKANIVPMIIPDSQVYNKFTKVLIRVPSRSPIHAKSESSIDEANIFAISPPIVKGTSWNLHDLTSHRQGVFDKKRKNWTLAVLGKNWQTPNRKIYWKSRPATRRYWNLMSKKLELNKKESWREEIICLGRLSWLASIPKDFAG